MTSTAVGYINILLMNDILFRSIVNYILFDKGDPTTEEISDEDLQKKLQDVLPLFGVCETSWLLLMEGN